MNRWMQGTSHMALMAPDGVVGVESTPAASAPASTPSGDAGGASASAGSPDASVSTGSPAPDAAASAPSSATPASGDAAAPTPESTPSLISAADGKPKPDSKTEPVAEAAKDKPAPAGDAKPEPTTAKADDPAKPKADDPAKGDGDAKPATDPATDATAQAPPAVSLTDLKLPEGIKLADEPAKAFLETLNKADLASKDRAQSLLDLHMAEIKRIGEETAKQASKHQVDTWNALNDQWKSELRNDKELGGNRLATSLSIAKAVIEEYLPAESAQKLFSHINANGMGNFPEFVRLLHTIGTKLNVFEDKMVTANPKPPSGNKGPGQRGWYDKMPGAPNGAVA